MNNRQGADTGSHSDIPRSDALRDEKSVLLPDPRSESFAVIDSGQVRPASLQDQQRLIASFVLGSAVPLKIRTHFETAKNLFLYAWFVYRFHPVAEQQALASLELALRERFAQTKDENKGTGYWSGLAALLKRAQAGGLIRNQTIRNREKWARELACERYRRDALLEMISSNAEEMVLHDADVQPTREDLAYDWIGTFVESLPRIRNTHAHGTSMLYPNVTRTFEIVSDLINQLYSVDDPLNLNKNES